MSDPAWLAAARQYEGLAEIPGKDTAPVIAGWLLGLKAWWRDDEQPWCGVAVAAWMLEGRVVDLPKHWYRARDWLNWGRVLSLPVVGCVVVFERGGGGHVGLLVGVDHLGRLMVLGGNQGNRVSIAPFDRSRVLGYRWPQGVEIGLAGYALPVLMSRAPSSRQEA